MREYCLNTNVCVFLRTICPLYVFCDVLQICTTYVCKTDGKVKNPTRIRVVNCLYYQENGLPSRRRHLMPAQLSQQVTPPSSRSRQCPSAHQQTGRPAFDHLPSPVSPSDSNTCGLKENVLSKCVGHKEA